MLITVIAESANKAAPRTLLAIALLLLCAELSWMAYVDLNNVSKTAAQFFSDNAEYSVKDVEDKEKTLLIDFLFCILSTVVLELIGFYAASFSLWVAALVVIASQVWFNSLARIQLFPNKTPAIVLFGVRQRIGVLVANGVALALLGLRFVFGAELAPAAGLLVLSILFLLIKYAPILYQRIKSFISA